MRILLVVVGGVAALAGGGVAFLSTRRGAGLHGDGRGAICLRWVAGLDPAALGLGSRDALRADVPVLDLLVDRVWEKDGVERQAQRDVEDEEEFHVRRGTRREELALAYRGTPVTKALLHIQDDTALGVR
jgi:hypothetical protein